MGILNPGFRVPPASQLAGQHFPELEGADDVALCSFVRAHADAPLGRAAFAALYDKHREAITAQAYTMTGDWARAEELAAETFTRVLRALSSGNGPQESVLGYLLIALRSEAGRVAQLEAKSVAVEPESIAEFFEAAPDFVDELSEREQIVNAFSSLSDDARQLLWLVEVEGLATDDAAMHLNMAPGALRVSLHRARKRLATSYLQQYVEVIDPGCLPFASKLASLTRRSLGKRDTAAVERHLLGCPECTQQVARLRALGEQLRVWVGPLVVGGAIGGGEATAGVAPSASATSVAPGAKAADASPTKTLIASLSFVAGIGLVIWGVFMLFPQQSTQEPTAPESTHAEEIPTPVDEQDDTPAANGTARQSPPATALPPPGNPVVEGDDATPHWYLQE